jgi:hypothetical protein
MGELMRTIMDELVDHEADVGLAIREVSKVLRDHRDLGGRWRKRSVVSHLRHAVTHFAMHLIGNRREPHLAHAATRVLMALQLFREGR